MVHTVSVGRGLNVDSAHVRDIVATLLSLIKVVAVPSPNDCSVNGESRDVSEKEHELETVLLPIVVVRGVADDAPALVEIRNKATVVSDASVGKREIITFRKYLAKQPEDTQTKRHITIANGIVHDAIADEVNGVVFVVVFA